MSLRTICLISIVEFLCAFNPACGQILNRKFSKGIIIIPSVSRGSSPKGFSSLNSDGYIAGSLGAYGILRLQNKVSSSPIQYLRIELSYAYKKGIFDLDNVGKVGLKSKSYDLALILPLTTKITETMWANVGLGGNISYISSLEPFSDASTLPALPKDSKIHAGLIGDIGFTFNGSSTALFGFRASVEFGNRPYSLIGIYFGFGLDNLKPEKK